MKVEEEVDSLKIIRIFLTEVAQEGHVETIDKITSIDMVDEANMVFGGPPGREGLKAHVKSFRRDISDLKIDIKDIVGNQKKVMAHWSFEGRHDGPWLGIPATKKTMSGEVFSFFTFKNGLISYYRLWLCANFDFPVVFDSSNPSLHF